ncbi:MAG: TldD/PmbA family protein, partial [Nanoarchaeota archaeon]|nr:TldD/PmbA family protein [Nanoarchaeota archaeon]
KEFSLSAADDVVKKLLKFVKSASPNKEYAGIAKGPFSYKKVEDSYDKKIASLCSNSIDYVEKAINKALASGAKRTAGVFENSVADVSLLTSNDVKARDRGTYSYFSIRAFNSKEASGQKVGSSRMIDLLDVEKLAEEATLISRQSLNPEHGTFGKFDIVFDSLPFANIIDNIGEAMSAFSVEAGLSCLKDMIGKKVASKEITIIDDGTLKNGFGSSKFDAEGAPTQRNIMIDKGIFKTYLHNTSTAKRFNTKTTANAGLLSPEPTNLIVEKGGFSKQELFEQVKNGLYITNLWYTRFQNYNTGDFSTIPRDGIFVIKNGKIGQPIKGIRISENMLNLLKNTAAIGKKPERVVGWEVKTPVITPAVLVKDVNITRPAD